MTKKRATTKQRVTAPESLETEEAASTALVKRDLAAMTEEAYKLAAIISQQQLAALWAPTPKHAIRTRPGPKGKALAYVSHGYVEFKLNQAFGGDWDIEPLPVFNGSVFNLNQTEAADRVIHYSVTVLGRLTVRVRRPRTLDVVTTITKVEFGSAAWYPENELGDALKAALSDALKRCGLRLGIALDLYYNDEREQQALADREKSNAEFARQMKAAAEAEKERAKATHPTNLPDMLLRVRTDYGKNLAELGVLLYGEGTSIATGMANLNQELKESGAAKLWNRIKDVCLPEFKEPVVIDQPASEVVNGSEVLLNVLDQTLPGDH